MGNAKYSFASQTDTATAVSRSTPAFCKVDAQSSTSRMPVRMKSSPQQQSVKGLSGHTPPLAAKQLHSPTTLRNADFYGWIEM
jgi:hypothetical protein